VRLRKTVELGIVLRDELRTAVDVLGHSDQFLVSVTEVQFMLAIYTQRHPWYFDSHL